MMKKIVCFALITGMALTVIAQKKNKVLKGMYLQWGYNREWYTKSNIHFKSVVNGIDHNFTILRARAHDRNNFKAIFDKPLAITIPQYNYRIGFYLNEKHTKAIELNFDHAKYIVYDDQLVRAKGNIGDSYFNTDTSFAFNEVHFEHTNGANFYQINYIWQYPLKKNAKRTVFTSVWKAGAGVLIPKTDITLSNKRIDNRFHVAGYCLGIEGGGRYFLSKRLFFEATAKAGFANYINSLAAGNGWVRHHFGYFEVIGSIGYDINL